MEIGFSQEKLLIKNGSYLAGYDIDRKSSGIHDDLFCKVLVLNVKQTKYCFVQFDLLCVGNEFVKLLKKKGEKYNLSEDHIFVGAIHTHSGPKGTCYFKGMERVFGEYNQEFIKMCIDVFEKCLDFSLNNLHECMCKVSKQKIENIYSDRHNEKKEYDNTLWKLEFDCNDGKKVIAYNFSCHPTVLHADNLEISTDLIGCLNRQLEKQFDMSIFFNGSSGNISTRFTRKSSGFKEIERLGDLFFQQINENKEEIIFKGEFSNIEINQDKIELKTWDHDYLLEFDSFVEELNDKINKGDTTLIPEYNEAKINNKLLHALKYPIEHSTLLLEYTIIKIENFIIVMLPLEITSSLTMKITKKYNCMIFGYMNGYNLYLADREYYDKKYYEAIMTIVKKGEGEKLIQRIMDSLENN